MTSSGDSARLDYWHDYKAGRLDRATFLAWLAPVRAQLESVLERGVASGIDRLAGSCANILEHLIVLGAVSVIVMLVAPGGIAGVLRDRWG